MPAKSERQRAKHAELLSVATDLFLERGYEGVNVDMIVAKAGGTKTNVYILFGSKSRLFQAVVGKLCDDLGSRFDNLQLSSVALDEALRTFGRAYLGASLSKQAVRQHRLMVAEGVRFAALGKRWFKAEREAAQQALVQYLAGLPSSQLAKPPGTVARLFLGALSGELLTRQLLTGAGAPSSREITAHVNEALSVVLHGVGQG